MSTTSPLSSAQHIFWRGKVPGLYEFNTILNFLPDAALIYDRSRDLILLANSALLRLTTYSQNEVCGYSLDSLLPTYKIEMCEMEVESLATLNRRQRHPVQVKVQAKPLDSSGVHYVVQIRQVDVFEQDLLSLKPEIVETLLGLTDLTDRYGLEEVLTRALEKVQKLLSAGYLCVYRAEPLQPSLVKFAAIETAPGVFPETLPSTDLIRLSEPQVWVPGRRVQTELHRSGRINNLACVATTPLGQEGSLDGLLLVADAEMQLDATFLDLLRLIGAEISNAFQYHILTDTLRKQILGFQELLAVRNAQVDSASEGILVLAPDLKIREVNPAAEWMLGYATWEVVGKPVEQILVGSGQLIPALQNAVQGITTPNIGNVSIHRRNGHTFPANIQTIPIMMEGRVVSLGVFLTDNSLDEEVKAQSRQLEQRAFLGDMMSIFAHEVRNPINNISTGLQLMQVRTSPEDPNFDLVNRLQNDCVRLNNLMESILSSSRNRVSDFKPLNLEEFLNQMLDRWRPRLAKVNVKSMFQVEPGTPLTFADPRALEQVFTNLISNAVEAMSASGGALAVKLQECDEIATRRQVEVVISDTGPGIPDEIRERIFEPFVTTKRSGTGLGLAITKQIITLHHGSIHLNSFPGGTIFRVLLPVYEGEES